VNQPEQANAFELNIPNPLSALFASCAVYCQVDCCGTNALDENAFSMFPWIRENGEETARTALAQLRTAIEQTSTHGGPIVENLAFRETWAHGKECADYLMVWYRELDRALGFSRHGCPSPSERMLEATSRGGSDFFLEVRRLTGEAGFMEHSGCNAEAIAVYSMIARLDASDESIASCVKWARHRIEPLKSERRPEP
jgi:hypothetical protein